MDREQLTSELIRSFENKIARMERAILRVEKIHGQIVHAVHQQHGKPKPGLETGIELAASHLLDAVREARGEAR